MRRVMPEAKHCGIWRKESCDTKSAEADGEDSLGAPASSVYECHSGGIVDTLDDLFDKAEVQLDDARKTETVDPHNYQMLKQSLVDEVKYASKE